MVASNGKCFSPSQQIKTFLVCFVSDGKPHLYISGNHAVASLLFPQNLAVVVYRYVFDFPPLK